jgi:small subunit ribosomal protein S6
MVPCYSVYTLPFSQKGFFMMRYELLMLSVPEITLDEAKALESQIERTIRDAKGAVLSFDRWGKYRLAYPVKKNDYGVYFLTRFEIEDSNELLEELKSVFMVKLNDTIMRHMISRLNLKDSLEYQKPQSLEEAPARDMNTFIRDNNLLSSGRNPSDSNILSNDEDDMDLDLEDEEA